MHVINVHYACDTPVTRSAGPCDCPDLPGRSPAALQAPTDQFNTEFHMGTAIGTWTSSIVEAEALRTTDVGPYFWIQVEVADKRAYIRG